MNTISCTRPLLVWLAASLPAWLPGQSPEATASTPSLTPSADLRAALARGIPIHDEGADPLHGPLGIWAAGADYKCGFADGAFTLVPYLGDAAPQNQPWRWRTTAAQLGDADLLGESTDTIESFDEWQFRRTRGLVTELWDVRPEGVEQRFVVAAPDSQTTARRGDLIVRGHIATPLTAAARGPAIAPLRFAATGIDYTLVYGTALAIDADGRRCDVPTSFDGEAITLHVPASFVAAAAWPIEIDPLLAPLGLFDGTTSAFQDLEIEAIPGAAQGRRVGAIWSRAASATDSDLCVYRAAPDLTSCLLFTSELSTTVSSREGSIAGSWIDGTMVMAWSRKNGTGSRCHARSFLAGAPTGSLSGSDLLPNPTGSNEWRPRVAAAKVGSLSPAYALVVRLRDVNGAAELWGTLFGTGTSMSYGSNRIVAPSSYGTDIGEPSLGKSLDGYYEPWIVAYQYWSPVNARWEVGVKRIFYTGAVDPTGLTINLGGQPKHMMRPRIDGTDSRYVVAFATAPTATYPGKLTSFAGTAIETQRLDWPDTGPTFPAPRQTIATAAGRSLHVDTMACNTRNRSHWLATVRAASGAQAVLLGYRGAVVASDALPNPAGPGTHVMQTAVAAYEPSSDAFPIVHTHTLNHQGVVGWTCTASVRAYFPQAQPLWLGQPCGVDSPALSGTAQIGTDRNEVYVTNLPANAPTLIGVSLGTSNFPLAAVGIGGGCNLMLDLAAPNWLGLFTTYASSLGYASLPLVLPETCPAVEVNVQFFTLASAAGDIAASRAIQIAVR